MFDEQKPREHELAAELVALEGHLRSLTPATPRIDRDRLMFAAGQAAVVACVAEPGRHGRARYGRDGRPIYIAGPSWAGRRFWPVATATMTAATLLLGTLLVWQNRSHPVAQLTAKPQAVVEVVSTPRDTDVPEADRFATRDEWSTRPPAASGYLGVRYIALTRGVGALPTEFQSSSGERDSPSDNQQTKPATARGLLDELLPAPTQSNPTRS